MAVKLAVLKSGEDVVANIREIVSEEEDKTISYLFTNPYSVKLFTQMDSDKKEYSVSFNPWIPLSKDKDIVVPLDWVVCVVDPIEMVVESYEEKVNGRTK
jgi:hypothetical protein